ncbi:MAG: YraN family protein [Bacteroidota bacterium]
MAEHNKTGSKGEKLARKYLEEKGYLVLETNWRSRKLEIDLIARCGDKLVVAEVKTRSTAFFGEPEEFVTRSKRQNLVKAAHAYLEENGLDLEVRFDIISVIISNGPPSVQHIEDAFYPVA